jgi:hypothetical protein
LRSSLREAPPYAFKNLQLTEKKIPVLLCPGSLLFYLRAAFILFRDLWYNRTEKRTSTSGNGRVVFFSLFMIFYLYLLSNRKKITTIFSFSL